MFSSFKSRWAIGRGFWWCMTATALDTSQAICRISGLLKRCCPLRLSASKREPPVQCSIKMRASNWQEEEEEEPPGWMTASWKRTMLGCSRVWSKRISLWTCSCVKGVGVEERRRFISEIHTQISSV